ncbi:MAG TPA: hypothetical protein VGN37_22340 [Actinocatenispora sp.]
MADLDALGTAVLAEALRGVREAVAGARFALTTDGAEEARRSVREIAGQLDDYLSPRLATLSGPLLVVVCGPTGAGKSTLVNSLVRAPVSEAGALRPTTRAPVLAASPADAAWFGRPHLLPTFARTGATPPDGRNLQVVTATALPSGLALLDAPDVDSVVAGNRDIAAELMAAADLWLFVTTASRYADDTAWQILDEARDRDVGVAVVLDRVPPDAGRAVRRDLAALLEDADLPDAPMFELAESPVDHEGLLPDDAVAPVRDWLVRLAGDAHESALVARQTLDGAVGTLPDRLAALADESDAQLAAAEELRTSAHAAHRAAMSTVDEAVRDGGLLAGELAARWDELIASGELLRAVRSRSGRLWDQLSVSLAGRAEPGSHFVPAAEQALRTLFTDTLTEAARRTAEDWGASPAGAALLPDVADASDEDPVTAWFDDLVEWVRTDSGQRSVARQTTYTLHAVRLMVLVAALVAPARTTATGTERAMLDTVLADPVVRRLAPKARDGLTARFHTVAESRRKGYDAVLNRVTVDERTGERLRTAAIALGPARTAAALAPGYRPLPAPVPPTPPAAPAVTGGDLPGPDDPLFHPAAPAPGRTGGEVLRTEAAFLPPAPTPSDALDAVPGPADTAAPTAPDPAAGDAPTAPDPAAGDAPTASHPAGAEAPAVADPADTDPSAAPEPADAEATPARDLADTEAPAAPVPADAVAPTTASHAPEAARAETPAAAADTHAPTEASGPVDTESTEPVAVGMADTGVLAEAGDATGADEDAPTTWPPKPSTVDDEPAGPSRDEARSPDAPPRNSTPGPHPPTDAEADTAGDSRPADGDAGSGAAQTAADVDDADPTGTDGVGEASALPAAPDEGSPDGGDAGGAVAAPNHQASADDPQDGGTSSDAGVPDGQDSTADGATGAGATVADDQDATGAQQDAGAVADGERAADDGRTPGADEPAEADDPVSEADGSAQAGDARSETDEPAQTADTRSDADGADATDDAGSGASGSAEAEDARSEADGADATDDAGSPGDEASERRDGSAGTGQTTAEDA